MALPSTASYLDRKNPSISAIRNTSGSTGTGPASPHTPIRASGYASTFSSPGATRAEEEYLIFELGARHIDAGFAGECSPRCSYTFGPSQARRIGDFREWVDDYEPTNPARKSTAQWGKDHELWQLDIRDEDLGLVEDKVDRALRSIYTRHLLLDAKSKAVALVLPSILPVSHVNVLLSVFYRSIQVPRVTLFPSPVLVVVGAGLRSGLVVDIGWNETIVTAVHELRQVDQRRSVRATKLATLHLARMLCRHTEVSFTGDLEEPSTTGSEEEHLPVAIQDAEQGLIRAAWCQSMADVAESKRGPRPGPGGRQISGSWPVETATEAQIASGSTTEEPKGIDDIPFESFCLPIESSLLANSKSASELDEDELPLPLLIHNALIHLPPDVRGTCMSRIMFTGGGSHIPGLKSRLLAELGSLVSQHGFDPVRGQAVKLQRLKLAQRSAEQRRLFQKEAAQTKYAPNSAGLPAGETPPPIPAGLVMPEINKIDRKLQEDASHRETKGVQGILRASETLGSWAGGSLALGMRIKAVVDVDRDSYLSQGLSAARSERDIGSVRPRSGFGATGARDGGWTLGMWGPAL